MPQTEAPFKAIFGRFLVREQVEKEWMKLEQSKEVQTPQLASLTEPLQSSSTRQQKATKTFPKLGKVCIVGAGVGGLYTAMILDYLGVDYDIFEASNRIGGRVRTHTFPKAEPEENTSAHNYYDIGAMRFPETPIVRRTFDLFKETEVNLKKYSMESRNQPTRYNDVTALLPVGDQPKNPDNIDPFKVSEKNNGPVPVRAVKDWEVILDDAYGRFTDRIKRAIDKGQGGKVDNSEDLKNAWYYLMRHDKFSLRDYLENVEGEDFESVHWLETLTSASGWFDQAFTENVLESMAFDYPLGPDEKDPTKKKKVNWVCVNGGTEEVTKVMASRIKNKVQTNMPVVKMSFDASKKNEELPVMVQIKGQQPRYYSAVINSTTLAALQKMDLTGMELSYGLKNAIRTLHYDTSTKVGIKFKTPWWRTVDHIEEGGLGKTDMPLRICVYPSYNVGDDDKKEAVLLASYTWGQDSERIAAHIKETSPTGEEDLKDLMLYNLARLHTITLDDKQAYEKAFEAKLEEIKKSYVTHHAFDWSKDEHASGAFALFSPGQFSKFYPHLVRPSTDSRFHIIGEAASAHHAWIAGALDSSVRGVHLMLERFGLRQLQEKLKEKYHELDELDYDSTDKQIALGKLTEDQMTLAGVGR